MSQPQDFGPKGQDPLEKPLKTLEQLVEVFLGAQKTLTTRMLGIEYEMFAQDLSANKPLSYQGVVSIEALFTAIAKNSEKSSDPLKLVIEEGNVVALSSKRAVIALEPGGQIEIAASPQASLDKVNLVIEEIAQELVNAAEKLNIALFAIGVHPLASREDMADVKKSRYQIMRNFMGHLPGLGLDMMKRSASIQLNLDFTSETDMAEKTRLAARLMPFFSLLCSSAAMVEGKPSVNALPRGNIWQKTDPARTGFPQIIFAKDFGYLSWIKWALEVPMYFIRRKTKYIDVAGASFKTFMKDSLKGESATVRDFVDHLSTIFTEVRLKPFLELRSPDSLPLVYAQGLATLSFNIFYNEKKFQAISQMLEPLSHQKLTDLHDEIVHQGNKARFLDRPIWDSLEKIFYEAYEPSFDRYLQPFAQIIKERLTIADIIRKNYETINQNNLPDLINNLKILKTKVF